MRRRGVLPGIGLLVAAAAARAQAPRRARIGVLATGTAVTDGNRLAALREGLAGRGHVEPATLELVVRFADGELGRLAGLAREPVAMRVDVIVTENSSVVRATMNETKTIPIVSAGAGDMIGTGLVASLARPGGNVTGLTLLMPDLGPKQLELLTQVLPGIVRIAVLRLPARGAGALNFAQIQAAAAARGIEVLPYEVDSLDEISTAFAAMAAARQQAVITIDGPLLNRHHALVANLAVARRLPVFSTNRFYVDAGTLASYGPNAVANWRRAAYFVDRILKGTAPADLPVEQPTTFELVINLRTAKALGLTIPQALLLRADEVIE